MGFADVIRKEPGTVYMMSNEAIVRAALEADVKVVSFYPGAPQTEVLDTFEKAVGHFDYRMEIAANEKVALETVAGASFSGQRSLTSMKSVGTNVASDALYSLGYTGVKAGCVCVIADDPHCLSSQSEQDGRWFGYTGHFPMLEPSNPQEAADMVRFAFDLSEKYEMLVLVRTTTRVNHQSGLVQLNEFNRTPFEKKSWKGRTEMYRTLGKHARDLKAGKLAKLEEVRAELSGNELFIREEFFDGEKLTTGKGDAPLGIITAGDAYNYAVEALMRLKVPARILKLGMLHPIPEEAIADFIQPLEKVAVVEELLPYLEGFVRGIAKDTNPKVELIGKSSGHFLMYNEYNVVVVAEALGDALGVKPEFDHSGHIERMEKAASILPARFPAFCAGCPHRATMWSLQRAVGNRKNVFYANDIGCYSMMTLEPIEWTDSLLCMGASLGVAAGVQYSIEEKVIVTIGDSTFFHACLPGIVNIVHHNDDVTIIVLENAVTAMTGQQGHPGRKERAGGADGTKLDIEKTLRGLGLERIGHINTFDDVKGNVKVLKEAIAYDGPSVVISHGECALYHFRNLRRAGAREVPFFIDTDVCENVYACVNNFMCPAISVNMESRHASIDPALCVGCGVCAQLCPHGAIKSTAVKMGGENRPYTTVEDYEALMKVAGDTKGVKE